jgi:flavin-dependent dehydrogenase
MAHFEALGVADRMLSSGGDRISETIFYERGGRSISIPSEWFGPSAALGLSRAEMDLCLMNRAREAGVEVREGRRVVDLVRENGKVAGIRTRSLDKHEETILADLFIDATGRSAALAKLVNPIPAKKTKPPYIGFKTHLRDVELERGRCEIYSFPGGYGGLSFVEGGVANFCFLMRADVARRFGSKADRIVAELIMTNRRAASTLRDSTLVYDWLAVAVEKFGRKRLKVCENLVTVGDAAAFIDPFTGSGMLLAFETGELLASAITNDRESSSAIGDAYERAFDRKFSSRLLTSSLLRSVAFTPRLTGTVVRMLNTSRWSRALLTRATRQTFSISQDQR